MFVFGASNVNAQTEKAVEGKKKAAAEQTMNQGASPAKMTKEQIVKEGSETGDKKRTAVKAESKTQKMRAEESVKTKPRKASVKRATPSDIKAVRPSSKEVKESPAKDSPK